MDMDKNSILKTKMRSSRNKVKNQNSDFIYYSDVIDLFDSETVYNRNLDYDHKLRERLDQNHNQKSYEKDLIPYALILYNLKHKNYKKDDFIIDYFNDLSEIEADQSKYIKNDKDKDKLQVKDCNKEYKLNKREKWKDYNKNYRLNNKELIKEKNRKYYEANREKWKDYDKNYRLNNKELIKEKNRKYKNKKP